MTDLAALLGECKAQGIQLLFAGDDQITIDAPDQRLLTPEFIDRVKSNKPLLLTLLAAKQMCVPQSIELAAVEPANDPWENGIPLDAVTPCATCGGLELWQSAVGDWRCQRCDPPTVALNLLEHTTRIRRKMKIPTPPGADEMLKELRRCCQKV